MRRFYSLPVKQRISDGRLSSGSTRIPNPSANLRCEPIARTRVEDGEIVNHGAYPPLNRRRSYSFVQSVTVFLVAASIVTRASPEASAQRPIRTYDPFYLGESATRGFFDSYAVSAEVSYFPTSFGPTLGASQAEVPATADQLGLNLRVEYHLASQLDLGVYVDAAGNTAGRSLDLSWISLKYFQRYENVDYAIRLAVDPASNGGAGFPQMDLGFLYRTAYSSNVASEYALGIRRVQMGFQQIVQSIPMSLGDSDPIISNPGPERELLRSQALGWEVHLKGGYNVLFDPAGSNIFASVMGEGGSYELIEWSVSGDDATGNRLRREFAGGVVWLRTGIQLNRPTFVLSPHISLPVKQWAPSSGDDWPRSNAYVGLSFTIR